MKIAVITVRDKGQSLDECPPWIAGAWDEWTLEENYKGFEEELARVTKDNPACDVRVAYLKTSDNFLFDVYRTVEAKAEAVKE